ncbi:MAG: response regulator [Polaromonas sp.]|nr:response regulator [Polaromonas sp.]
MNFYSSRQARKSCIHGGRRLNAPQKNRCELTGAGLPSPPQPSGVVRKISGAARFIFACFAFSRSAEGWVIIPRKIATRRNNKMTSFGSDIAQKADISHPPKLERSSMLLPLRVLLLLFIAAPLLAYIAGGAYLYQQMRAESELRLDRAVRLAREHALKIFETNEIILNRILDAVGNEDAATLRSREKSLHEQFQSFSRDKAQTQSIWIWDAQGQPLANDRSYPVASNLNIRDRSFFNWHAQKRGGLHIAEPITGYTTGETFITMSYGRYAPTGSFTGLASIGLHPSYFQKFYKDIVDEEPGMAVTLLHEDGSILARWPLIANQPTRLAPNSPVMSQIRSGKKSGNAHGVSSVDGRNRLLTYSKVGNYPVYLGTGMDTAQIRQRWMREMAWLAAFGLPPMLGLFLAARIALRRTRDALDSAQRLKEETLSRRQVEEALLQAQKMEALGRLTGGVAHDFNNALMVINTNLYLLKRKHPSVDGKHVESISRAIQSATKLTRQLLAFSRRQPLVPEYLNLQERLATVHDLLTPVLGKQIQIVVEASADTKTILVDSAELELALINLAINAKDAMPSGGRFSIVARNATTNLPAQLTGDMVVVAVSDTGMGIKPDLVDKVFEPFFTTKPVGEGTGLGLSQIYGLCQRAGGLATLESQVGVGTTVNLFFPAMADKVAAPAKALATSMHHLARNLLLVEDNDEVATALIPALEAMGCKVTHFDRAIHAGDWLARQACLPDLLLSDVVMPGAIDGLGLALQVAERYPELKTILMTGYAEQLDTISRLGFEVIPKPCSPELLADTIERVMAKPHRPLAAAPV